MRVYINLESINEILGKRGLEERGAAQQFLGNEVARLCDPYVPMQSGILKNTALVLNDGKMVVYSQPYSAKQYYENQGNAQRGKLWDKRMMADHGEELIQSVAEFIDGGKT